MSSNINFLSETNHCGQTLLQLVAHGNAIIAELLRLSNYIPPVFFLEDKKYQYIIFDFKYLKNQDAFDNRITSSADLLDLDENFKDSHMPLLERFYTLFKSIYNYYKDFIKFMNDLDQGYYIQQTLESILVNQDGKQLLAESLYLYGCMLLLLDLKIPGPVRERMLMSYFRYKGAGEIPNIDDVCKLCRSTGFDSTYYLHLKYFAQQHAHHNTGNNGAIFYDHSNNSSSNNTHDHHSSTHHSPSSNSSGGGNGSGGSGGITPPQYPESYPCDYFNRFALPDQLVSMIIGRLRSDDIYLQTSYYPLPEHRSVALSTQAAMLFIILYFKPNMLNSEQAVMREIVDKHFPDNWVLSYYMGFTVDLTMVWKDFKAANLAIQNIVTLNHVKNLTDNFYNQLLPKLIEQLNQYLIEGVLVEEYVLDNINRLLSCLRECNVTLRWLLLHRTSKNRKVYELIDQMTNSEDILLLLLNTAQFEFLLKQMFQEMLDSKEIKWSECKNQAHLRMIELSQYFSGEKALTPIKDEQLQEWFSEMSNRIIELDYHDSTLAGRRIQQVISALEDVEQFHQIEQSLQVKQYLSDTRLLLKKMIRYVNIRESVLVGIAIVSDISYAWEIVGDYVKSMQRRIKKDPSLIIKMRSTFLKLSTMLELPLVRISQAKSQDIVSVSQYYSSELVKFVRFTLEIIPMSMFSILNKIIEVQTNRLEELPTKLPRNELKRFSQLDERYDLSRSTYEVSKYTEGILAMERTLMGIVEIDPKQLLEDGIRKELVRQIAMALHSNLIFNSSQYGFDLLRLSPQQQQQDDITSTNSHSNNSSNNSSSSSYRNSIDQFIDQLVSNNTLNNKKMESIPLIEYTRLFEDKLGKLHSQLDGMLRSFEYIQDYVHVYGLKLWQEEFSRIIMYNVEQECNTYLKRKVFDFQSLYQSEVIPIPRFKSIQSQQMIDKQSITILNFMGRLMVELLVQTDSRRTIYIEQLSGWYDYDSNFLNSSSNSNSNNSNSNSSNSSSNNSNIKKEEIIGLTCFTLLQQTVSSFGLVGLDLLLSYRIVTLLNQFVKQYLKHLNIDSIKKHLKFFKDFITPPNTLPEQLGKIYEQVLNLLPSQIFTHVFLYYVMQVGTCQLLRKHIASQLLFTCKLNANPLFNTLTNLNHAILKDVEHYFDIHYKNQANQKLSQQRLSKHSILPSSNQSNQSNNMNNNQSNQSNQSNNMNNISIKSTRQLDGVGYPSENNPIFSELTQYLQTSGMHQPFEKIYITPNLIIQNSGIGISTSSKTSKNFNSNININNNNSNGNIGDYISVTMFLFVLNCIERFIYVPSIDCLVSKKKGDILDGTPFIVGIYTVLKQFHSSQTHLFLSFIGQYIRANTDQINIEKKGANIPDNVIFMLRFIQRFCKYGNISQKVLEGHVPSFLFTKLVD
ncbi:predicted protein [Naegleria gruberi]|uniref:Predicted protein n=1 Tax=Naegleria gruberi TaxID=5762 RepID=D2VWL5_NAEGR|nr:uncharacterized protein NAEGRDRAFT_73422 [Naegleria gruberi]EFC38863.1 predicted protein [Naegleria gruberi]|eukprot:XP_002671607.1 predicted protein [Naegleria gruberi strain NEG-M]